MGGHGGFTAYQDLRELFYFTSWCSGVAGGATKTDRGAREGFARNLAQGGKSDRRCPSRSAHAFLRGFLE